VTRIDENEWQPYALFDTGGRPIFYPPSVIFSAEAGGWGLAFGSGDREDLWSDGLDGRFYVALESQLGTPLSDTPTESALAPIPDPTVPASSRALFASGGWYLDLGDEERLIADPFTLSGVVVFTTYVPHSDIDDGLCRKGGASRLYVMNAVTGESFQTDDEGEGVPYREIADFVASPFVESSGANEGAAPCEESAALSDSLRGLFPPGCEFASQTLDVMTVRSDSGLECVAPVPICVRRHNWLEVTDGD
jgi:hypothetical protein